MALSSPGTQITIIDESQYLPAAPNSIPLVVIATAQNKATAAGTGIATATTKANAGKLYQVTSQRDLITYFGNPFFYKTTNGTSIHGYELNEYGLLAAYSTLGSTNLIYAIRADIDLASLIGKTGRPTSQPDNGSWWLDTANSTWGIFEFDAVSGTFANKKPVVVTTASKLDADGVPLPGLAAVGSYAVNMVSDMSDRQDNFFTYWYRAPEGWVSLGSAEWRKAWPTVQSTVSNPTFTVSGNLIISRGQETANVIGTISDPTSPLVAGTQLRVTRVNSSRTDLGVGTIINGPGILPGTYITALGTGTGGVGTYTVSQKQLVTPQSGTITGSIAGTTLTVTTGSTLTVGTVIDGHASVEVANGLVSADTVYSVETHNRTNFNSLIKITDATSAATINLDLAGAGVHGFTAYKDGAVTMVVTAVTNGVSGKTTSAGIVAGRVITRTNSTTNGLSDDGVVQYPVGDVGTVLKQTHWLHSQVTHVDNVTLDVLGQTSMILENGGAYGAGAPHLAPVNELQALAQAGKLYIIGNGTNQERSPNFYRVTNVSDNSANVANTTLITFDQPLAVVAGQVTDTYTLYVSLDEPVVTTGEGISGTTALTVGSTTGLATGMTVSGTGVLGGTYITAINTTSRVVTLSSALEGYASGDFTFYDVNAGGTGIYKTTAIANMTATTTGEQYATQPTVGTVFTTRGTTDTRALPTIPASSPLVNGVLAQAVGVGTFVTAVGSTAGTYTVSVSQTIPSASLKTYTNTVSCQYGDAIAITPTTTVADIADAITELDLPAISAVADDTVSNKLSLYYGLIDTPTIDRRIQIAGDLSVLSQLGITAGTYAAPGLAYGTNANQPLWRSTDAEPHPTGSVWIKTNAFNGGLNLVMSQYSSASGTYVQKTPTVAPNEIAANERLDATGGQAIAANSIVVIPTFTKWGPMRFFYRASTGASTFIGTESDPSGFEAGSSFSVQVSVPGSQTLSDTYVVRLAGTTGTTLQASDFIDAWNAATLNSVPTSIPYTTATLDAGTGAIVLTHTEGGIIVLDDSTNTGTLSPLSVAGFTVYDVMTSTGTIGAKYGDFKTVDYTDGTTNPITLNGNGSQLTIGLSSAGYIPTATIVAAGSGYTQGDILTVPGVTGYRGAEIKFKVTGLDGTGNGGVSRLEHYSGLAQPQYKVQLSDWEAFPFIADDTAPVNAPTDGTPWFYSVVNQIDIMVNSGGAWRGYNNVAFDDKGTPRTGANLGNNPTGPIISASVPGSQTDGTALVYGDLWIDSGDLENFPVIYRWQSVNSVDQWVLIDNADQTTEKGILFADARWGTSGDVDPINDKMPTIQSLLTSDYVDLDCLDAALYPQGMLLFNMRRSGYNVKKFQKNYFNAIDFPDAVIPTFTDAWVTASGLMSNGAPYMGRRAQRAVIVQAMKALVDTSSELRDDQTSYNLIVAPGYPELQPNMIALNNDRNNTAYIIGDTPLRLRDDANDITKWATNAAGATATGEFGLVTRDTYLGIYYPSGITTDLTGADVVVPASHMMLRTMIHNDNVAYPWFAPAGMRRGVIDNATNIGYIDAASGEFQTTQNRVALRDVEYTNFINPIAYFRNIGLLNYGNKNSYDSQSALDRTNVARLICYIRDRLQVAVRPFLFEPNDARTRDEVKGVISTLLADIKTKRGVYDYLVVCDESNNTPARIDRNELWIDIAIEPVKAIEFIYIPVRVLNTGEIAKLG